MVFQELREVKNLVLRRPNNVIQRADSRSSFLNPQKTEREKCLKKLEFAYFKGNSADTLRILQEIKGQSIIRDFFQSSKIGIENRAALDLFSQMANDSSAPEIQYEARRVIFDYAREHAGSLVIFPGGQSSADAADDVIDSISKYLDSDDVKKKHEALSELARSIGYHITDRDHPVPSSVEPGAKVSKKNNLLYHFYQHRGIGRVIYDLLDRSNFIEDNKVLMRSKFTGNPNDADKSLSGDLPKANLFHFTKRSILGSHSSFFGFFKSSNFEFKIPKYVEGTNRQEMNKDGSLVFELDYNLESFLKDVCDGERGVETACDKFIEAYTQLISYEERLKLDPANEAFVKSLAKQRAKALKFLFDSNQLQSMGIEGEMIHKALQEHMMKSGGIKFLNGLYSSFVGPNENAVVMQVSDLFKRKIGCPLVYFSGNEELPVRTLEEFRISRTQYEEDYTYQISQVARSILKTHTQSDYNQLKTDFNRLADEYKAKLQAIESNPGLTPEKIAKEKQKLFDQFKSQTTRSFAIAWSDISESKGEETIDSLIRYAKNQLPTTFEEYGDDYEKHIKSSKLLNALESLRVLDDESDKSDELILRILDEDKDQVERHTDNRYDGKLGNYEFREISGHIESLLRRTSKDNKTPHVESSIVGCLELIRRINLDSRSTKEEKNKAKEKIFRDFLGIKDTALIKKISGHNLDEQQITDLYDTSHIIRILDRQDQFITEKARENFRDKIVHFMSRAVPSIGLESLESHIGILNKILENKQQMSHMDSLDEQYVSLDLENKSLLNFSQDELDDNGDYYRSSVINPRENPDFLEIFVEILKAAFDYIKIKDSSSTVSRANQFKKDSVSSMANSSLSS
jgi:hypothetical protein